MSVVIRGMKMPTSCSECAFCGYYGKGDHMCDITGKDVVYELSLENRLDDCPLVGLPAQHGRLIDADALNRARGFRDWKYENGLMYVEVGEVVSLIKAAHTIIEAEVSE